MCLFTQDKEPKIAQENITVYKVMRVSKVGDVTYGTPPYHNRYTYSPGLNVPTRKIERLKEGRAGGYEFSHWYSVEEGYLHAYVDSQSAFRKVNSLKLQGFWPMSVVEMYIPAGTKYYIGDDYDIASEALYWPDKDKNS